MPRNDRASLIPIDFAGLQPVRLKRKPQAQLAQALAEQELKLQVPVGPYATFYPGVPFAKNRGWLTFTEGWSLDPVGDGGDPTKGVARWDGQGQGKLELVLPFVAPNKAYAVQMSVDSAEKMLRAVDPAFVLHLEGPGVPGNIDVEEGEFAGGAEVASHLAPQTLFLVLRPPDDAQFVVLGVVPKSIGHWAFHSAAVFEVQDL